MSTRSHLIFAHYWCAAWAMIAAACLAANIMDGPAWLASADTLFLVGYLKWANDAHREAQQALRGTP